MFFSFFRLGSITHESQPSSAAEDALARYQERITTEISPGRKRDRIQLL